MGHPWQLLYCATPSTSEGVGEWAALGDTRHSGACTRAERNQRKQLHLLSLNSSVCVLRCEARCVRPIILRARATRAHENSTKKIPGAFSCSSLLLLPSAHNKFSCAALCSGNVQWPKCNCTTDSMIHMLRSESSAGKTQSIKR